MIHRDRSRWPSRGVYQWVGGGRSICHDFWKCCGLREKIKKKKRRNEKGRKKEKRVKEWKMLTAIPKFTF